MYNEERFKRQPASLYGADGFLERHQIEDELLPKLRAVCESSGTDREPSRPSFPSVEHSQFQPVPSASATASPAPMVEARSSIEPPVPVVLPPEPPVVEPDPPKRVEVAPPSAEGHSITPQAKAPAPDSNRQPSTTSADPRNESALRLARIIVSDIALYNTKPVDEGVLQGTFFDLLRSEIEEGRRLYQERCSPELSGGTDYFQQTLEQFVETRRRLLQRRDSAAA